MEATSIKRISKLRLPAQKEWIAAGGHASDAWTLPESTGRRQNPTPAIRFGVLSNKFFLKVDGKTIAFPEELGKIGNEIDRSRYILDIEAGWDEDRGLPVPKNIWASAVLFLINYAKFIFKNFSLIVETPEINPCPNGTVDLSWDAPKAQMLANVRTEGESVLAFYYGDFYHNRMPIKGNVPVETVEEHLAYWMKNLAR